MAETAIKVAPYIKKYVIDPQVEQAEKDAEVIKQQVIQPKVETILDAGLREAGLTGGFSDWMHWGDKGGSYGGFSSSACKTNPGGLDCFNQMVRAMHPQRQGGMGDKGGRPLFSKQEEQNLRDWGYNLDRLHKLEHKYKF